ncbi:alpha/beta hydrolase [Amycolatopsis rubida]|uniref:Alpha/beta hydrolase n=1 Tax=Amycolatopsis rubida TaxID=112413 RepID=A0ABX0C086_9PSEU|nr:MULTISPECIES: alpha/beta hydrolase [Amycolatopsis]MYW96258.1 alpha/beta fold hydrolase [Amycolatopsis rubida]NEC61249.1 alpha/beta hydrolase [Amycolatopsis rubida]OAP24221.1 2-hydroxy-6-oxo-6-(2'-aminophenyl)hexa-2,4-dienoic acid hydrolase [Amycolatopsis sp. M39]
MTNEIIGRYATVDGTRVYYEECGEGVPVFCIHTAGACSIEYYEFLPAMAAHGFRVIAVDLPGHGKSYPVNWEPFRRMHDYAEFVWRIIETVCGDEKPIVLGTSIGGDMTVDLACHHSAGMRAALALEGAAHTPTFPDIRIYEDPHACPGWRDQMERAAISSLYYPTSDEKVVETRWMHRYAPQEIAVADLECWANHDVREHLANISCPIMIFKGEADYYVPDHLLQATVEGIRDGLAEFVVGPRMGHYPMFEQPEALTDICVDFLKRHSVLQGA